MSDKKVPVYLPNLGVMKVPNTSTDLMDAAEMGADPIDSDALALFDRHSAGKTVGYTADNERFFIPNADIPKLIKEGGRVATYQEALDAVKEKEAPFLEQVRVDDVYRRQYEREQALKAEESAPNSHGDTRPRTILSEGLSPEESLARGQSLSDWVESPEHIAAREADLAERKEYEDHPVLTAAQGLSRYYGGDYIREGLNVIETKIQNALGIKKADEKLDFFEDKNRVLLNKKHNAGAAVLGEFASLGSMALLSGGVATPASLISDGANLAAQGLRKAAPKLPEIVGKVVASTTEGAAWGGLDAVNNTFMTDDWDRLGENVVAGATEQGLAGFAMGGALHASSAYLNSRPSRVLEGLDDVSTGSRVPPRKALLEPLHAPELGRSILPAVGTSQTQGMDIFESAGFATKRLGILARNKFASPDAADAIRQDLHREIRLRFRDVKVASDEINSVANIAGKRAHLESSYNDPDDLLPFETAQKAVLTYRRDLGISDDALNALMADKSAAGKGVKAIAYLQSQMQGLEEKLFEDGPGQAVKGTVYTALDQAKRSLGTAVEATKKNPYLREILNKKYHAVRDFLEDENLWGEALAAEQRKVNKLWAEQIQIAKQDALRGFYQKGSKPSQEDLFRPLLIPDDAALDKMIHGLGVAKNETLESAVINHLDSTVADANMRAVLWGTPAARSKAEQVAILANDIKHGFTTARRLNTSVKHGSGSSATSYGEAFFQGAKNSSPLLLGAGGYAHGGATEALAGMAGTAALGGLKGVVQLGVTRWADRQLKSSFKTIDMAVKANEKLLANSRVSFQKSLDRKELVVRGHKAKVQLLERNAGARDLVRDAAIGSYDLGADVKKDIEDQGLRETVQQWLDHLYSDDDDSGSQSLLQHVKDEIPEALQSVTAGLQRQRDFLASKLDDPNTSPEQAMTYALAVMDPTRAVKAIASGDPAKEHIEALSAVYPSIYRDVIARVESALPDLDYQDQLLIRSRMGLPAMEPAKIAKLQALASGAQGTSDQQVLTKGNLRAPRPLGA